jgi:hypothetical protein
MSILASTAGFGGWNVSTSYTPFPSDLSQHIGSRGATGLALGDEI